MAAPLIAGLPPDITLQGDYLLRFAAVDPTTGAPVAGVVVSGVSIFGAQLAGPDEGVSPLPMLVPSDQVV